MTDLRKRLSVTTLAFLALAFCGLLIGQAVANSERARDVNADYSIETGVPLPSIAPRAPQQSGSLSEPIAIDEDGSAIYQWEAPSISNDKHQKEGSGVKSAGTFSGGGDTPGTATVIAALPYTDSGDLTGAVDDYPLDCGFGDPGSPTRGDLFYSFTPAASAFVTFSLCNSVNVYKDFVIKLWEGDPSTTGVELTCDEDGCVAPDYGASRITGQFVAAGVTYYLQIKCWSATAPAYVLDVYLDDPFSNAQAAANHVEGETCGQAINGGCSYAGVPDVWNGAEFVSDHIADGRLFGWTYQRPGGTAAPAYRDGDTWRFQVPVTPGSTLTELQYWFNPEIDMVIWLRQYPTEGSCTGAGTYPGGGGWLVAAGNTGHWTFNLAPGWYSFQLRPNLMNRDCLGGPTGESARYSLRTALRSLYAIDDCPFAYEQNGDTPEGSPIVIDMTTMTTDGTVYHPLYGVIPLFGNAWINFTPSESGYYTISACTTPQVGGDTYDLYMAVWYAPCPAVAGRELAFNDDGLDCPGWEPQIGEGTRDAIVSQSGVIMGENVEYLISIADWNYYYGLDRGEAWIEIWHEPLPLLNNNCAVYRTPIEADQFAQFFHNLGATLDGPAITTCTNNDFGGDVWYEVTAWKTGHLYAKFCNVNFDANVEVYAGTTCPTNTPPQLVPIRCNDDGCPDMATYGNGSYVDWPVVVGEKYLIRAGGWYSLPTYPLTAYGMGFGWYDLFITDQPDTLKGPTLFGTTTVPQTVGLPVNDACVDVNPVALVTGVPVNRTGNVNWVTRDACATLPPNGLYSASETWEAFTVPAGGCMHVAVDYFLYTDLCDNTSRASFSADRTAAIWIGCPCEGDFFEIRADRSCCNQSSGSTCTPAIPGGNFNYYHEWSMLPSGDYWYIHNHWTIGGNCGWGDYVLTITGNDIPCTYCTAGSNPAQCTNLGSWINRVILKLALPTNMPGDTVINNSVAGTGCHSYENFTGLMAKVYRGFNYALQVRYAKVNETNYQYDTVGYWIDWNQNAVFFDPGERYIAPHGAPIEGRVFDTLTIPMTALAPGSGGSGTTLFRIRLASTGDAGQPMTCGSPMFGEVEDYVLTVKDLECGDFNIDGNLNGDDIAFLRAWYFGTGPAARIWQRGDIDGDGHIDIADIIGLADAAFRGGALHCSHM